MDELRKDVGLLRNIVTFRTASVSKNFTVAGAQLGVSRVAVSRQIAELEQALNVRLFVRSHREVSLTKAGLNFAEMVNPAMQTIADALAQQRGNANSPRLTITVTSSFATYWLMPRLIDFGAIHPDIEVNLVASDRYLDIASEGIDVAIRYSPTAPEGKGWIPLMQETIFPVFSPSYDARTPLASVDDLTKERLLFLSSRSGRYRSESRWDHWFRTQGVALQEEPSGIHVNTYINMLQAAIEGQGIALAGRPLVDAFLDEGVLVMMEQVPIVPREYYYLYVSPDSLEAQLFSAWLTEKMDVANSE